jgi:type IV secretory pathway TrbL component
MDAGLVSCRLATSALIRAVGARAAEVEVRPAGRGILEEAEEAAGDAWERDAVAPVDRDGNPTGSNAVPRWARRVVSVAAITISIT